MKSSSKLKLTKTSFSCNSVVPSKSYAQVVIAKPDTGASNHYFSAKDAPVLTQLKKVTFGPTVTLPDMSTIQADQQGFLPLPNSISPEGSKAHVFEDITNASLISIGQLCDDGCEATFDKEKMNVSKNGKKILTGVRNLSDGLWDVKLQPNSLKINAIIRKDKSKVELAEYLHACAGSPPISSFLRAIKNGNLITWPGIDSVNFSKFLKPKIATAKGHLNQEKKNLQSTKPKIKIEAMNHVQEATDFCPPSEEPNMKTLECFSTIIDNDAWGKAYHDLTGQFPHVSTRGNKYILVHYDYDSNAILAEPLKNRTSGEIKRAWLVLFEKLKRNGNAPKIYIMDNEASHELKQACKKYNLAYQLVPPHMHRRNAAERAIQSFKNHFLALLATCDPNFPVEEWDRLLSQCLLTLNLLRNARVNTKLSAWTYLFGNFNFNATPLAPPGTKILLHLKSKVRGSWSYHGEEGWYIGPSLEHYRCVKCFIPKTSRERDADTVEFFPHSIEIPSFTTEALLQQTAIDMVALLNSPDTVAPSLQYGDKTQNALLQIATLLNRTAEVPNLPKVPDLPVQPPRVQPTPILANLPAPAPRVPVSPVMPIYQQNPILKVPRSNRSIPNPKSSVPLKPFAHYPPAPMPRKHLPIFPPVRKPILYPTSRYNHHHGTHFRNFAVQHLSSTSTAAKVRAQHSLQHIFNESGKKETMDSLLAGKDSAIWWKALGNELGRLSQGIGDRVVGTETLEFIHRSEVPSNKKVTYANFICDHRPLKEESMRVRLTVGGDRLEYTPDAGSPAASILETKLTINSVISDASKGAKFMGADLKDFFLASPMEDPEYMRIHSKYFPPDVRKQYNIDSLIASDKYVYVRINKGMYGLIQAATLAYKNLVKNLEPHGYFPCPNTTGLWKHVSRPTTFCLCVDDFGIKYYSKADADHLLDSLRNDYKISTDWEGKNYCGLTLEWNYKDGYVDISMPGYIEKVRTKLCHPKPKFPQHAPHRWTQPSYGSKVQMAPVDDSPLLDKVMKKKVQSCTGSLLYYARTVDSTMLPAINEISAQQSSPTEKTWEACKMLLDYACTYPNAKIRYYASDMCLHADTDAAYLVQPNARSRYAGFFYLSDKPPSVGTPNPRPNGAILVICRTLRGVLASAAETETGGVFHNAQTAIIIRRVLEALGHPQPPTPLRTDNSVANSFVHANIKQRRSKTWDMRWNWLRDKELHDNVKVYWGPGKENEADYFTKHHPPSYHKITRPRYILQGHNVSQKSLASVLPLRSRLRLRCARVCSNLAS